jgi:pyruvate/2-oxoglutarate dehydrogenase complex dihydrolipoamide dehydrogenase (E3) component
MTYDYDLIVVGGGAAGLVAAKLGAGLGKKVAIVEKSRLGGECTLYGCVPSKTLIKTAKVFRQIADPGAVGLAAARPPSGKNEAAGPPPAAAAAAYGTTGVFPHVRSVVEKVYQGHRPEVLEAQGIRVFIGQTRFLDNHRIETAGAVISARSFIICTGSGPLVPPIPGIDTVPYLTNETLFDLDGPPASMAVLGGGPIGMEMAQAFAYLGTAVTVIEAGGQVLAREDRELARLLADRMAARGIALLTNTKAVGVARKGDGVDISVEETSGRRRNVAAERLLVAVGRKPNVEGLNLEAAGVDYSQKGIRADGYMRTTAPNVYTCGDVTGPYQFSHMAEYQARIAARNALIPFKARADYANYIWCTFTDPEFAHAGLTEEEAVARHGAVRVYRWRFADTDRGRTEGEEFGMAKFICDRKGRLLGAHILGARAGELIHEAQIVKTLGIPFHRLDSVIHVYPTLADVVRQPAKLAHIDKLQGSLLVRIARRLFGKS